MRFSLASLCMILLLIILAIVHLSVGARHLSAETVFSAFVHYDPTCFDHQVIRNLRLLRLVAALVTGASLGVAGVLLQAVIRNPLGEPHILGINAGGALAVVLTMALGFTLPAERPLIAASGAGLLFSLVLLLSSAGRAGLTPMKVTLCGIAISAFASSVTAAVLLFDEQTLQAMRLWLAGDLAGGSWDMTFSALWVALAGLLLAIVIAPALNMLALGDKTAAGLGIAIFRTRMLAMIAMALLCGAALSVAGPIGFIGLVVPLVIRRLVTTDIRIMIPLAALCGGLLLLGADILARILFAPHELATGVVTALLGAPFFILLAARFFK